MALVFDGILHTPASMALPDDGRRVVRTIHGKVKSRIYHTESTLYEIPFVWSGLTAAQVAQIKADYAANSDLEFEVDLFDAAGIATRYEKCHWKNPPAFRPHGKAGGRFDGNVTVYGNEQ